MPGCLTTPSSGRAARPSPYPKVRARPATSIFSMLELACAYLFNTSPREPCLCLVTE
jgi:hypothetical protein